MWDQYKRTFWKIQIPIVAITVAVYLITHGNWRNASLFFVVMEISSLIGANWASRVRRFTERDNAAKLRKR